MRFGTTNILFVGVGVGHPTKKLDQQATPVYTSSVQYNLPKNSQIELTSFKYCLDTV